MAAIYLTVKNMEQYVMLGFDSIILKNFQKEAKEFLRLNNNDNVSEDSIQTAENLILNGYTIAAKEHRDLNKATKIQKNNLAIKMSEWGQTS